MEYKILNESNIDRLERSVNENIKLGWEPQGGIAILCKRQIIKIYKKNGRK